MKLLGIVLVLGTVGAASAAAGKHDQSPFVVPPNGKPEQLVGGIDYTPPTALAFDTRNRPYLFNADRPQHFGALWTLRNGRWVERSYLPALKALHPDLLPPPTRWPHALGALAIDDADRLFAVLYISRKSVKGRRPILLFSADLGETFQARDLPGNPGRAFLEVDTGNTDTTGPPAIGLLTFRKPYPTNWTSYYDLHLLVPEIEDGRLRLPKPVLITRDCFGVANHSGGYSFAVTVAGRTHVTYAEIPKKKTGGNPTFVATYDRKTRKVTARQFLCTALPGTPDVHSTPVIAADAARRLHVVAGAHNNPFRYTRSLEPNTIEKGWTKPVNVGAHQTYATLVCDTSDVLHTVYRIHGGLYHQRKKADDAGWSKRTTVVKAPAGHRGYTIFYHRLFVDRTGALYLSFTFWETRTQAKGRYPRALVVSADGGRSWQRATTESLNKNITGKE